MACKKCGSDWVTATGKDCKTCPHCSKRQRHDARQQGRWVEPTQQKACEECGIEFTAIGLHDIAVQVTCKSQACKAARRKRNRKESAKRRAAGIYTLARESKPKRYCKFSECGKELTRRDQKDYCCKQCYFSAVNAGEQQFKGRTRDAWAGMVDWAYEWESQRPEWMQCEVCQKVIERQTNGQRICGSNACRHRLAMPLRELCLDCGEALKAHHGNVRRCNLCKKKRRNAWKKIAGKTPRKRCKRHQVPCDPSVKSRAVFERDGFICQLCGRRCLDKFTVVNDMPHLLSPTVDHIFAISLGIKGHTWDNVQCACWSCNVAKGARATGQLRLAMA